MQGIYNYTVTARVAANNAIPYAKRLNSVNRTADLRGLIIFLRLAAAEKSEIFGEVHP